MKPEIETFKQQQLSPTLKIYLTGSNIDVISESPNWSVTFRICHCRILCAIRCCRNKLDVRGSVHGCTVLTEKPNKMQECIKILLFLILNKAQHVSGDTPSIIRNLKLHKQPLVLHNTVEGCRTCNCWTLSGSVRYLTTSNNLNEAQHVSGDTPHHQEPKTAQAASGFAQYCGRLSDVQLLDVVR